MANDKLKIRGARHHNLKDIDVEIPKNSLVVISGLSGSGKSTLAFDTIYAEGQRRYVESLSAYARQFLEMMDKPDVDSIEGLSPAISIQQKTTSKNPRSTVGTITEIYDYMRLLYARIGIPYCTNCGRKISTQSAETICDTILKDFHNQNILVLAPIVQHKKGTYEKLFEQIKKDGYSRIRVDGEIITLDYDDDDEDYDDDNDKSQKNNNNIPTLDKQKWHNIEIVVDRLSAVKLEKSRLFESIETALKAAKGYVMISYVDKKNDSSKIFSQNNACPYCGITIGELEPRTFSFNSPFGMCNTCNGLGSKMEFDPDLVIPDKRLSILNGAISPWGDRLYSQRYYLESICKELGFNLMTPLKKLSSEKLDIFLYGTDEDEDEDYEDEDEDEDDYDEDEDEDEDEDDEDDDDEDEDDDDEDEDDDDEEYYDEDDGDDEGDYYDDDKELGLVDAFPGIISMLQTEFQSTVSESKREWLKQFMLNNICDDCGGKKLKPEALAVKVNDHTIMQVCDLSISDCYDFFNVLNLSETEQYIAKDILKEIKDRLEFLRNVGLNYLTLNRSSATLSGGESQRIRLATQIGSNLTGVLYVLDEPTIGLHQRDNARLIKTLSKLRDLGNTVIVVEHDEEVIRSADWILDLGPGAGVHGGDVVFEGTVKQILKNKKSITGKYLKDKSLIRLKDKIRKKVKKNTKREYIKVLGAKQNNLKNIDVEFPLRSLVTVTGVSGSGKSTLVNEILLKALSSHFYYSVVDKPGKHKSIQGIRHIDKVIAIDQSPIGRTPRSNPATYIGVFTAVRELYASTITSKERGYKIGRFSFNVQTGRCDACDGDGVKKIEMQFLSDVYVKCNECKGKRYNSETLSILYKGKNISDVLDMTIEEALHFFENIPKIKRKLQTIYDVGLGYIKLGQSSTTLSGGEAQRVKLAAELSKTTTGNTLYILDEPTTGLHFADVQKLLEVLNKLVGLGNTAIVIEHNMDVIKNSDWIVDLGPEGGDEGGKVVAVGTPEQIANAPASYTGKYLKKVLAEEKPTTKKRK